MKITAIGGSLRPQSYAYRILEDALKQITDDSIQTELIDLRKFSLPFCQGELSYPAFPDVERLRQQVKLSTGLLIATPEYHGSISGVLKNALDLLEDEHMTGKVVGLIAVVGGVHSTNAINTLRLICQQLHCWVLPEQVIIPYVESSFKSTGELVDSDLQKRLYKMVHHLVEASKKLRS
jgi:FMN reductase